MTPSIDFAKKLAAILNTIVGCLLDESGDENVLKDPDKLTRLNDCQHGKGRKNHILYAIDRLIKSVKFKNIVVL
jgi:hypothetical protein